VNNKCNCHISYYPKPGHIVYCPQHKAAPNMYQACQQALIALNDHPDLHEGVKQVLKEAIAKAQYADQNTTLTITTITIELSPEIYIALKSLCQFYKKTDAQVIEMAIENIAADAKLIAETLDAKIRRIGKE
jgi:hypothetical protein